MSVLTSLSSILFDTLKLWLVFLPLFSTRPFVWKNWPTISQLIQQTAIPTDSIHVCGHTNTIRGPISCWHVDWTSYNMLCVWVNYKRSNPCVNARLILLLFLCVWLTHINRTPSVMPRSRGFGDITVTYIRRSEIPLHIYAKYQYRQESECESTRVIYISNHRVWYNITVILHHQET